MSATVATARANLYDLIAADATVVADQVQVTYGPPDTHEEQEVIALGGVESHDEDDAVIGGARPREETYTLVVQVKAHGPENDPDVVDARGFELAEVVRSVVYADRSINGAMGPTGWARVSSITTDGVLPAEGGGFVIYLTVRVLCRARIN